MSEARQDQGEFWTVPPSSSPDFFGVLCEVKPCGLQSRKKKSLWGLPHLIRLKQTWKDAQNSTFLFLEIWPPGCEKPMPPTWELWAFLPSTAQWPQPNFPSMSQSLFYTKASVRVVFGGLTRKIAGLSPIRSDCSNKVNPHGASHAPMMNFALRYGGNRTYAGANPGLIRSQTLTTRPTVYIQLVPSGPITCDGNIRYQSYIHDWPSV